MFTTFFNQTVAKPLLVIALLVGTMAVGTVPAAGQVTKTRQFTLTPAQQAAYTLGTGLSPYERHLLAIAVVKLGAQRADAKFNELAQFSVAMPGFLSLVGPRIITPALQTIPAQYHQSFIDGLFSVTPVEEQYAKQVMARAVQILQMQTQRGYMPQPYAPQPSLPSMGMGNFGSDGDPITQREDLWKLFRDITKRDVDPFRKMNWQPSIDMDLD